MTNKRSRSQSGSVFTVLLGGIALTAALGITTYQLFTGPVSSVVRITQKSLADTQLLSIAKIAIMDAANQASAGDCDADGFIEPRAFRDTTGNKPVNGGLVPLTMGAPVTDPWKSDYGYCVWDVGPLSAQAGCGGATGRIDGADNPSAGNTSTQTVMAIISAGPDRQFQTTCNAYVDATTDLLTTTGDDYILRFTYQEAASATSSLWNLKTGSPAVAEIKKDLEITSGNGGSGNIIAAGGIRPGTEATVTACAAGTNVGMIRYNTVKKKLETCVGTGGWVESGGGSDSFSSDNTLNCAEDLNPADGTPDHRGKVRYNTTSSLPEYCNGIQWLPFTINIPGVNLVISPQQQTAMNVDGGNNLDTSICTVASGMTCGAGIAFTVTNSGNTTSGTVAMRLTQVVNGFSTIYTAATLANVANGSNFVATSNTCTTTLAPNASCVVTLKPKANGNVAYTATLIANINNIPMAIVSGTASNFGCFPGVNGGGGKYSACGLTDAGTGATYNMVMMPGGCTGSVTDPVCAGGSDTVTKAAAGACCNATQCSEFADMCFEENFGARASVTLMKVATIKPYTFPAVQYCDQMVYNGYSDWYLPARYELLNYVYPSRVAIGGFVSNEYQASHISSSTNVGTLHMGTGALGGPSSVTPYPVRCARRDNIPLPTVAADSDPDPLTIAPSVSFISGARTSSGIVTVSGIYDPASVAISGGSGTPTLKINGGAEVTSGSVANGNTLQFVMDAPTVIGTKNTATITIGPDTYTWWVGYADQSKTAKVFVTSGAYEAHRFNGVIGANAICNSLAAASSMGLGAAWKALISDNSNAAASNIPWSWGTLQLVNGTNVVDGGIPDLFDGSLDHAIDRDEKGNLVGDWVVTGSNSAGTLYASNNTCSDYTGAGYYGSSWVGNSSSAASNWISSQSAYCHYYSYLRIYCVEDINDTTVDAIPSYMSPPYAIQVAAGVRQTSTSVIVGGMSSGTTVTLAVTATGGTPTFTLNGGAEVTSATVQNGDVLVFRLTAPATANSTNRMTMTVGGSTIVGYWRVWTGDTTGTATKRLFVTSTAYNGNLGGVAGADAKCDSRAAAAGLGGTWKAIISDRADENNWAVNRIGYNWSTLELIDGTDVSVGGQFWNTAASPLLYPINKTELGTVVSSTATYTNTTETGVVRGTSANAGCANWTGPNDYDLSFGNVGQTGTQWINGSNITGCYPCSDACYRLYCIEQ